MATIKDVAKLAGVSVATVSRVLNDYDNVRGETAQDRKSTRLNSSHLKLSRMPSSA